jgi:endonuclease-3
MSGKDTTTLSQKKQLARTIFRKLKKLHHNARTELNFANPHQLLVATILSAQCTDARVNEVTKKLFKRCRSPRDYLSCSQKELETIIHSAGFFRQKAKSILGAMKRIVELHSGQVPFTMEELTKLPGVGRKTANVVLGNAFGIPGLPVDTHVKRVANRLGLTQNSDPVKIEEDLTKLLQPKDWTLFSHTLIFHGRRICAARKPACERCPVSAVCGYYAMK